MKELNYRRGRRFGHTRFVCASRRLGNIIDSDRSAVVIAVGYNDSSFIYARGIDQVLAALRVEGVEHVFWVTLRAVRADYLHSNEAIFAAAKGSPGDDGAGLEQLLARPLLVVRTGRATHGKAGAEAMAGFIHDRVLNVLLAPPPPPPIEITVDFPTATVTSTFTIRCRAAGGVGRYRFTVTGLPQTLRAHADGTISGDRRAAHGRCTSTS